MLVIKKFETNVTFKLLCVCKLKLLENERVIVFTAFAMKLECATVATVRAGTTIFQGSAPSATPPTSINVPGLFTVAAAKVIFAESVLESCRRELLPETKKSGDCMATEGFAE